MANLICIEQKIAIAGKFDGTLPTTTPVDTAGVRIFPADATGGLFTFFDALPALPKTPDRNLSIKRIDMDMNGLNAADTFELRKICTNGDVIFYANGPGDYVWTPDGPDGLKLAHDESLKLFNGLAAVAELFVRIWAEPFRAPYNTPR